MTQYHLAIDEGDVAPTVLMPGDPGRVPTGTRLAPACRWDLGRSRYARKVSAKGEEFDPDTQFEHTAYSIQRLARLGCEIVRELHEQDQRRASRPGS